MRSNRILILYYNLILLIVCHESDVFLDSLSAAGGALVGYGTPLALPLSLCLSTVQTHETQHTLRSRSTDLQPCHQSLL